METKQKQKKNDEIHHIVARSDEFMISKCAATVGDRCDCLIENMWKQCCTYQSKIHYLISFRFLYLLIHNKFSLHHFKWKSNQSIFELRSNWCIVFGFFFLSKWFSDWIKMHEFQSFYFKRLLTLRIKSIIIKINNFRCHSSTSKRCPRGEQIEETK